MTKRKSFNISDSNNKDVKALQKAVRQEGNIIQQANIINLAIELFFRDKTNEDLIKQLRLEHII